MRRRHPDLRGDDVLDEIAGRVRALRESDSSTLPPLLLLGVMERVGSNWVSDALRPVTGQHNEPFRQQVGPAHPLSALNTGIMSLEAAGPRLGLYGRHWLVAFAAGKYAPIRQVIKETNLFFALPALLTLFPDSLVAVLTRSPLGVASSFARGDLSAAGTTGRDTGKLPPPPAGPTSASGLPSCPMTIRLTWPL
jgi:hypothetical protein